MGDCIACGSRIPKKSRFCPGCGSVVGGGSDTQLGRRLSNVRDEISASQDAIKEAKKRWIFKDEGTDLGANYSWLAGFSLAVIVMIIAGLVKPMVFMTCCFPIIALTCPPLYVSWKNQRKLVKLEIEEKSLQVSLGGKGVDITKSYKDDEGSPKPKKWLPKKR